MSKARWFGKVTASLDTASGNTDETGVDLEFDVTRRGGSWELNLEGTSSFRETGSVETRKRYELQLQSDYDLSPTLYVTMFRGDITYDKFQNIDYRIQASAGLGVNIIRTNTKRWKFEAAPAYQVTRFREVAPGESREEDNHALRLGTGYEWEVNKDVDFSIDYESYVGLEDIKDTLHSVNADLSIDITGDFEINFGIRYDRNEESSGGRCRDSSRS